MDQKQSTPFEQMTSIINRADNSSTRITVKITEMTQKKIKIITSRTSATFKTLFKDALIGVLPVLELLTEGADKDGQSLFKSNSTSDTLLQKTFVVTNNSNRVLDDLSTLLKINKSRLFSIIINLYYKLVFESKLESSKKNLNIYKKIVTLIEEIEKHFEKVLPEITSLLEDHEPNEFYPHPLSDQPIERFLSNVEAAEITLSNSRHEDLEEAIKDCNEIISLAEEESSRQ